MHENCCAARSPTAEKDEGLLGRHSQCLFRLVVIWIEPIGRKLFNIALGQASQFSLAETLGEVQQGLRSSRNPSESQSDTDPTNNKRQTS